MYLLVLHINASWPRTRSPCSWPMMQQNNWPGARFFVWWSQLQLLMLAYDDHRLLIFVSLLSSFPWQFTFYFVAGHLGHLDRYNRRLSKTLVVSLQTSFLTNIFQKEKQITQKGDRVEYVLFFYRFYSFSSTNFDCVDGFFLDDLKLTNKIVFVLKSYEACNYVFTQVKRKYDFVGKLFLKILYVCAFSMYTM